MIDMSTAGTPAASSLGLNLSGVPPGQLVAEIILAQKPPAAAPQPPGVPFSA